MDSETLTKVADAIELLQNGNGLIGIITHVHPWQIKCQYESRWRRRWLGVGSCPKLGTELCPPDGAIMFITRVTVSRTTRCLKTADVPLNEGLNVIVGNNECGKSTLLEAVHLALSGQINGRPIQSELTPPF